MAWKLAPSLAAARNEANAIAPKRSRVSDGTIGDAAHQSRTSDHNVGARDLVHALDLTYDPQHFDVHAYLERIRKAQDPRVKYLISRRRIAGPGTKAGGWAWHSYTGSNPHDKHGHISIWSTVAAETDTRAWWPITSVEHSAPAAELRLINTYEVDVPLNTFTLGFTTDDKGNGWDYVPYPRAKIIGHTAPGLRPGTDQRYLVGQVGFAEEGERTVVSLTEWAPKATAVIYLTVVT